MVSGPYEVPNAHLDSYAVYTNNVPGGAFRGFGGPQAIFAAESQMNKAAAMLGIDPVQLRMKNVLREGSLLTTQTVIPAGVTIAEVVERCAEEAGWGHSARRWGRSVAEPGIQWVPEGSRTFRSLADDTRALRRGRGFACALKNVGFSFGAPERCEATIELRGSAEIDEVILRHGAAEVGQGTHTALAQMTAMAVGVPLEKVRLDMSDTATSGDSGSVSASRMTWMAGSAIRGAAERALAAWHDEERPAVGHFRFVPPATTPYEAETGTSYPNFTYGYVAQAVDVVVDVETGVIHVERVVSADDVGKAINAHLIEGQIEGAIVQAVGYALMEDLKVAGGRILNPTLSTYLIPGILDVPERVHSVILEFPDPIGPWGLRGMAEMPFLPLAPAIAAAVFDATGVWFSELPLTPERIVAGLRQHGIGG
jgi:CO/xanthine dehydrogenase Mo-binding subunit